MSYWINHLMGDSEVTPSLDNIESLYDELANADQEHTDVSLIHESEWCLSAYSCGALVWENVADEGEPKHIKNAKKQKVISLWKLLAQGKIKEIDNENWLPGYS